MSRGETGAEMVRLRLGVDNPWTTWPPPGRTRPGPGTASGTSRAPDAYRGEENTPLGKGHFTVAIEKRLEPNAFRIVSTAMLGGVATRDKRFSVIADVVLRADGQARVTAWVEDRS